MAELSLGARLRLRLLGVDDDEIAMERRGFTPVDERAREQLEGIAATFLRGYHAALREPRHELLAARLDETDLDLRGFAYEGAAMGLTVLDALVPTRRRLRSFLRGPGFPYAWMAPIGYGWARAQMRRRPTSPPLLVDPLLDWFALDGAGFHDGYFHPDRYVDGRVEPRRRDAAAARVYDQGIGRSLWFVRGADVERIHATIASFRPERRPFLWSGLASAATYAGGVGEDALAELAELGREHGPDLAQGAAFAAKARLAGGNVTAHTEAACAALCDMTALDAARCTDAALEGIRLDGGRAPYDAWRERVRELVARGPVPA
jgi:hypothetical protein